MLIILDLDGTLTPQRSASYASFERVLLPGVKELCARGIEKGYTLAIATNQGGAREGRSPRISVGAVLAQLRWVSEQIGASAFRFATTAERKKPEPAMLVELMVELDFLPRETVFVGDSESDALAAAAAGIAFAYVWDVNVCET